MAECPIPATSYWYFSVYRNRFRYRATSTGLKSQPLYYSRIVKIRMFHNHTHAHRLSKTWSRRNCTHKQGMFWKTILCLFGLMVQWWMQWKLLKGIFFVHVYFFFCQKSIVSLFLNFFLTLSLAFTLKLFPCNVNKSPSNSKANTEFSLGIPEKQQQQDMSQIKIKPVYATCEWQRFRSACACMQSDQHLYYLLLRYM